MQFHTLHFAIAASFVVALPNHGQGGNGGGNGGNGRPACTSPSNMGFGVSPFLL